LLNHVCQWNWEYAFNFTFGLLIHVQFFFFFKMIFESGFSLQFLDGVQTSRRHSNWSNAFALAIQTC